MILSAKNQLKGTIISIKEDNIESVIKLDVGGDNIITAIIPTETVIELNLTVGSTAYAIINTDAIIIGVEFLKAETLDFGH